MIVTSSSALACPSFMPSCQLRSLLSFLSPGGLVICQGYPLIFFHRSLRPQNMAFDWEKYREEICDLYLVQRKTMKQIATLMQVKYGFNPW